MLNRLRFIYIFIKSWADPEDFRLLASSWNQLDKKNDRRSHEGLYKIVNGRPINPKGRTGITGRGQLGKWGPNHAADPIVTRFVVYLLTNNLTQTQNLSKMSNQLKIWTHF